MRLASDVRRSANSVAVLGCFMALSCAAGAQIATQPTVLAKDAPLETLSHAQFAQRVQDLQRIVSACKAAASACHQTLASDESVSAEQNLPAFAEHWDWLRSALASAAKAKPGDRATTMDRAADQLSETLSEAGGAGTKRADIDPGKARQQATEVLARSEFRRVKPSEPTWWDRKMYQLHSWIAGLIAGASQLGAAAPWLGKLLEWGFFIAAAVGLLLFARRSFARQQLKISLNADAMQLSAWGREANDWAAEAERCAATHEWRDAVHCIYWAAIVRLEAGRAWRHNPTRTPREYVRLLQPGSAQQGALRGLTGIFERVWYGLRTAESHDYERAKSFFAQLGQKAVTGGTGAIVS